jgi:hypothetical protein
MAPVDRQDSFEFEWGEVRSYARRVADNAKPAASDAAVSRNHAGP